MKTQDDLLTMNQAAEVLRTSRATLYRWLREGKLQGMKTGRQWRFKREELSRFLEGKAPEIDLPADITPFLIALAEQVESPYRTDKPLQDAFNLMIQVALEREASSFHLGGCLPEGEARQQTWLRYRVDGVLQSGAPLDSRLQSPLVSYWKRMAACDQREKHLPQDGRILVESRGRVIDLRVSFLPTRLGEMLTVKIHDRGGSPEKVDDLGLGPEEATTLKASLRRRSSLLVVAGPAGSARERVLTACLRELAGPSVKLMTIEAPPWHALPWAHQIGLAEVSRETSVAVGTLLRSEPDVLALAKIPDQKTLEALQEVAFSGALVVSGLVEDGCLATLRRLLDLAGSVATLLPVLDLILSQRLVRRVCTHCNEAYQATDSELEQARHIVAAGGGDPSRLGSDFRRAKGCSACGGSGYRGRKLVLELLPKPRLVLRLMAGGASSEELMRAAVEGGMKSLDAQTVELAAEGVTTLDEAIRLARV